MKSDGPIETDYLVVGAGAMALAFIDEMMPRSEARFTIVDRQQRPGGHWLNAYPFVRLHQPSAYYGVSSKELGRNTICKTGRNAGLRELATKSEILRYFDALMADTFVSSGRVDYLPGWEWADGSTIRDCATGQIRSLSAGKIVDGTCMKVKVPSTDPPRFAVANGAHCVPPNFLTDAEIVGAFKSFCVIGAGKTSYDSIIQLFDLGVAPEQIRWVKPREAWLLNRAKIQPDNTIPGHRLIEWMLEQTAIAANATSMRDLLKQAEQSGSVLRLDPKIEPTMFRCATVSLAEAEELRRIRNIIRAGRVSLIEPGRLHLERATITMPDDTLYINCTSDGLEKLPVEPVFQGDTIRLQTLRPCQQVLSAGIIGVCEALLDNDAEKNALCTPTQHPNDWFDYASFIGGAINNVLTLSADPILLDWMENSRIEPFVNPDVRAVLEGDPDSKALMLAALQNIQSLYLAELQEKQA